MADKHEKKEEVTEKVAPKFKGSEEVILVDKDGNESVTTKAFYDMQKDAFALAGVTPKK
jgi:hypothetical protein